MQYWLVKSDPDTYGWEDFIKDGQTFWDGVRNFSARNHMKGMKRGDQVLFYHSQSDKAIVGIAEVIKEAYPDPTTDDQRWVAVDLKPVKKLAKSVELSEIKQNPKLSNMYLVRQSRLSVMPVEKAEFEAILKMS